jgi:Metal-dependent hydrolases of the beta-lactamase superfamily III
MDAPRITLFSTPLVSTWVFDETHRVLFDAGDGVTALLDSRIHKIRLAAITHTHRDHCAGLMQLLNLRGGAGDFVTVYPEGSGSARALANFLTSFDSRSTAHVKWHPLGTAEDLPIEPERHFLRGFETDHYPPAENVRARSLGYQIVRHVDKLKPEFRTLPQTELDALRAQYGRAHLTETLEDILLTVTGDTMPLDPAIFRGSRALMHEATFLDIEERAEMTDRGHPHTCFEEALDSARQADVGILGLYHVSRRYEDDRIIGRVREICRRMAIRFPVCVALPGRIYEHFFSHRVWEGRGE